jgi:hypothetical protein
MSAFAEAGLRQSRFRECSIHHQQTHDAPRQRFSDERDFGRYSASDAVDIAICSARLNIK